MHTIIETGGKQYKIQKGDVLEVEKLNFPAGEPFEIEKKIAVIDDNNNFLFGEEIKNLKVLVELVEQKKGKKLIVFKFKAKTKYRKKKGHRQNLSKIKIADIIT